MNIQYAAQSFYPPPADITRTLLFRFTEHLIAYGADVNTWSPLEAEIMVQVFKVL